MARRVPLSVYDRLSCGSFVSRPLIHGYRRRAVPVNRSTESQPGHVEDGIDLTTDIQSSRSKINLHPLLRLALLRTHGISQLNSIQESAYMTILSGKDVTLHAPIGSGKTLAYLLPIVNNIYNIHDLLEDLQLRNGGTGVEDDRIRMNALGHSRKVPHAMLTRSIKDLHNDPQELQAYATQALESNSTTEKLVDTLYKVDPRQIRRHAKWLPIISRKLWGRRSRNSIFRALMANPLGSVRCCVIVVPNKDLVAQVISELRTIDPLGRLSIQTLTQLHSVPVKDSHKPVDYPNEVVTQPLFPSMHTLHYLQEGPTKIQLSHEDEKKMLENVPTVNIAETTLQMIPINRARVHSRTVKVRSNDCVSHGRLSAAKSGIDITGPHCPNGLITADGLASYGVDGLVPRSVEYAKRPIMIHPVIQYGSCDIVVTTPQLFLNDMLASRNHGVVPACVVFDEVDMLLENNASRSAMMELCSMLRPRPKTYHPLVNFRRPRTKTIAPCQFVKVASTLNYGGMQTAGSMLYERFSTSCLVSSGYNHLLGSGELRFIQASDTFDSRLRQLVETLVKSPYPKTLIYASSLDEVRKITELLRNESWPVLSFHSRSSLVTRLAILETFKSEEVSILVATDLLTRGIVLRPDHVIHFSFPTNATTFLHRNKGDPKIITGLVSTKERFLASEIYRAYKMRLPINYLLSRKRSLSKRQKSPGKRVDTNNKQLDILRNTSDRQIGDGGQYPCEHTPLKEPSNSGIPEKGHMLKHTGTLSAEASMWEGHNTRLDKSTDVKYVKLNPKRRGREFYNNFNDFS